MTYYKVLGKNGEPCHGGSGAWHLPHGKSPGKWMPKIKGKLEPCRNGYHGCDGAAQVMEWLSSAYAVYEMEFDGKVVTADNKVVGRRARLLRQVMGERELRLFACDCAERVLAIFEATNPDDKRPRQAIEVARRYANGEATDDERAAAGAAAWAAAGAAAWAAVGAAARNAAWAAARAAARAAAWDAARAAVGAAARAAAWDVACDAERKWQVERLQWYLIGCPRGGG